MMEIMTYRRLPKKLLFHWIEPNEYMTNLLDKKIKDPVPIPIKPKTPITIPGARKIEVSRIDWKDQFAKDVTHNRQEPASRRKMKGTGRGGRLVKGTLFDI